MKSRPNITATIITLNEEESLLRTLESLAWVEEIVVVDCGSVDKTQQIAQAAGAKVIENKWQGYGQQKNFAMEQATHDWVLNLDADEVISPELKKEIELFLQSPELTNYRGAKMPRRAWYLGRWIRHGGWYPNYTTRLSHKKYSRWTEPPIHESLGVDGKVYSFSRDLLHYPFSTMGEQINANVRYAQLGAATAKAQGEKSSLMKILSRPTVKFLETYIWKRGFLDGFPGFVIAVNSSHSMFMKYVEIYLA